MTNPIKAVFDNSTKGAQEEFLEGICASYSPFLCVMIRRKGDKKDIFCKKLITQIKNIAEGKSENQ